MILKPRSEASKENRTKKYQVRGTGFRSCVRTPFPNLVPQGRLNFKPVEIKFEKCLGSTTTFYGTVALSFVIPTRRREICGSRTSFGNANTTLKHNYHLACPGAPWDRSVAEWRDLRFSFFLYADSKRLMMALLNPSPLFIRPTSKLTALRQQPVKQNRPDFLRPHSPQTNQQVTSSKSQLTR